MNCKFCLKQLGNPGALTMHEKWCISNPSRKLEIKSDKQLKSLYDLSSRTAQKILKRINASCSNCGWNKTTCDIHHIIPRKNGGTNEHSNLTLLCPNCHRLAHEKKLINMKTLEEQFGDKWKNFYFL